MNRMEKNKKLRDELRQSEQRANRFARKTRNRHEEQAYHFEEDTHRNVENSHENQQQTYQKQAQHHEQSQHVHPSKKLRKKHHPFRKLFVLLLLVVLGAGAYSVYGYQKGYNEAKKEDHTQSVQSFHGVTSSDGSENILLIGNDSRDGENSRSDSIMVLHMGNSLNSKPKIISFMRDTYVTIPGVGDNKINASYAYGGAELLRETLKQNFNIDCKYYFLVDFKTFEKVIDALFPDGVQIDAEKDMSAYIDVPIKKGPQKMNGFTLLQYARFRMDEEGDFGRVRRQQQVMNEVFKQVKSFSAISKMPYAAGKVMGYSPNDIPMSFILKHGLIATKNANGIQRLSIPVENSWQYGESYEAGSYLEVDKKMNQDAIENFLKN
ncbi:LCP family protein [uncultured Enterococcus sp.]|uniref:LCP family protein n=1 Tax=uncultured Enterococcus sp. TaxID=167972 RepID=UPI00260814E6|nr:LCP family protein [uncultured Enterococcus sp.]